jgi:hypothetical protein
MQDAIPPYRPGCHRRPLMSRAAREGKRYGLAAPLGTAGKAALSACAMRTCGAGCAGSRCGFSQRVRGKTHPLASLSAAGVLEEDAKIPSASLSSRFRGIEEPPLLVTSTLGRRPNYRAPGDGSRGGHGSIARRHREGGGRTGGGGCRRRKPRHRPPQRVSPLRRALRRGCHPARRPLAGLHGQELRASQWSSVPTHGAPSRVCACQGGSAARGPGRQRSSSSCTSSQIRVATGGEGAGEGEPEEATSTCVALRSSIVKEELRHPSHPCSSCRRGARIPPPPPWGARPARGSRRA